MHDNTATASSAALGATDAAAELSVRTAGSVLGVEAIASGFITQAPPLPFPKP